MKVPAIAAASLLICAATAGTAISQVQGQPGAAPAFEVASVKFSNPDTTNPLSAIPGIRSLGGGRLAITNATLPRLVQFAYGVQEFQLVGGPSWQASRRFDISAKAESPDATPQDLTAMLRTLLAERFQLKTHMETRELPVGVLRLARSDGKLGPKMSVSTANCMSLEELQAKAAAALSKGDAAAVQALVGKPGDECSLLGNASSGVAGGGMALSMKGQPMSTLAALLTQLTGKTVHDKTGLTGRYNWELTFDPEILMRMVAQLGVNVPSGGLPESKAPALLTALQEQLGLKLENDKMPGEVLVIDSAQLPTPD